MRTPVKAWRGPDGAAPAVPLPPGRMPLLRGGRPLKRWTWVGAFGEEIMLCAACARVGPAAVSWWAVWDRGARRLGERTWRGARGLDVTPGRVRVAGVMELEIGDGEAIEVVSPHGRQYAWTRKRGGVPVQGTMTGGGGRAVRIDARGIVDESAGYHARHTAWRWAAGVGVAASGAAVAWNLVDGLHDGAGASERTLWVDGEARPVGPVRFGAPAVPAGEPATTARGGEPAAPPGSDSSSLAGVTFAEGGALRFTAEATRSRRERLLVFSSDYEQPFGTVSGELPGVGALRRGWGVMERHDVRW